MSVTIYHNPRWSKSRESVKILQKECKPFNIVQYMKEKINQKTLENILNILNIEPIDLIRKNEKEFKTSDISLREKDRNKIIQLIIENPKIMERPIILNGEKGVIGRPPENIYKIL